MSPRRSSPGTPPTSRRSGCCSARSVAPQPAQPRNVTSVATRMAVEISDQNNHGFRVSAERTTALPFQTRILGSVAPTGGALTVSAIPKESHENRRPGPVGLAAGAVLTATAAHARTCWRVAAAQTIRCSRHRPRRRPPIRWWRCRTFRPDRRAARQLADAQSRRAESAAEDTSADGALIEAETRNLAPGEQLQVEGMLLSAMFQLPISCARCDSSA